MNLGLLLWLAAGLAAPDVVVVRPLEIHEVLVNPGMGIQTFQRFSGDPLNPALKWSEQGPEAAGKPAGSKPDSSESSIAYFRWFWAQLEPEPGRYRWEILDRALEAARQCGQQLAIRIMPYDEGHPLPAWYRNSGTRRANRPTDKDGQIWSPDAGDPLYLKHWGALVRALGARYDGHPYLDTVDISTVGYWGEGWGPYLPDWAVQQALIDLYFEAFPRTLLLVNFDEPRALGYGTQRGAGWRLDCWGDLGGYDWSSWGRFLIHMLDVYPQQLVRVGAQNVWQRSPVSLETCWTPAYWKQRDWDIDYILEQALRWHASSVNLKSTPIPPEWRKKFEEFQKKVGYRFRLRRLEYPKAVKAGQAIPVNMWWLNAGVTPVYRDYVLAVQLYSAAASAVIRTDADVKKWLPGDVLFEGNLYVPEGLPPGAYRLRVGLLDPRTGQPAIRLAIEGRQPEGWHDVGAIQIQ